jgi:peptidyl-prolyl cis-trans isomerase A (cyclophilin A)
MILNESLDATTHAVHPGSERPQRRALAAALAIVAAATATAAVHAQPRVTSVTADNRGRIVLEFDRDMQATGLERPDAISILVAGEDGVSGTNDDKPVSHTAKLDPTNLRKLVIQANIELNDRYSILLRSIHARDLNGNELDGEFNGPDVPSGDGQEGGDFACFAKPPDGNPIARIVTNVGSLDIELYRDQTPLTVQNFLDYANKGDWDQTFVHRLVPGFVWQGGGFDSKTFERIPQNIPVLNEPGISNKRGTVAMAKLPNHPNSATNEWFFNLVDNSANLDQQNGGFTVFAKVVDNASLAIMDAIAGYPRINASHINSAFTDLPVLDDEPFYDKDGEPIPEPDVKTRDLIAIERISLMYRLVAEPFQSIDPEQTYTIAGPDNNAARVTLFNLDGNAVINPESLVEVVFGGGNSINRITILDSNPGHLFGIQIHHASQVGSIIDRRSAGNEKLAFILCDAPVGTIQVRSLVGYDINLTRLPDGTILPPDIDGDGQTDDPTAMLISGGTLNQLRVTDRLVGSVVMEEGVRTVRVDGPTTDCTFVVNGPTTIVPSFTLNRVINSSIDAPNHGISLVKAVDWTGTLAQRIHARGLRTLQVTGLARQYIDGNFHADLVLTGLSSSGPTLSNVAINGDVRDSNWTITGGIGPINIRRAASRWNLEVNGNISAINVGRLAGSNITNQHLIGRLNAGEWLGGTLTANNIASLVVRPNPAAQGDGTFEANIAFNGTPLQPFSIGTMDFRGPVRNAVIQVPNGRNIKNLIFRGVVQSSTITINSRLSQLKLPGEVLSSTFNVNNVENVLIGRWIGGTLNAGNSQIRTLKTVGVSGQPGDLHANVVARSIQTMSIGRKGSYKGVLDVDIPERILIQGDLVDSVLKLGAPNLRNFVINKQIAVSGDIKLSRIESTGQLGVISASGLIDSQIVTGPPNVLNTVQTIPDSNPGLNLADRIKAVNITVGNAMVVNSFVLTGVLDSASMNGVSIDNGGAPFGIAVGILNSFRVKLSNGLDRFHFAPLPSPQAWGDFQIRPNFQLPTEQSP